MRNAQRRAGLSDREPEVLSTRHELALFSENPEAELAEVARLKAEISGPGHRYPAQSEAALALELAGQGRVPEAQALLQRAGDVFREMDGPQNSSTLVNALLSAVLNLSVAASPDEALERLAEVRRQLQALRELFGEGSPHAAQLNELEALFSIDSSALPAPESEQP